MHDDPESFEEQVPEESRKALIRRVLAAGSNAPTVLLEAAINANGKWAASFAEGVQMKNPQASTEELISRAIKAHTMLARSEGASLGLAITAAEVTSVIGTAGTLTPATAAVGLAGDLVGLAWIQTRMVLVIAALSGHDPKDSARYRELLTLMGVYGAPQSDQAAKYAGRGAERVLKRLILRHLKGDNLKAVKALFNVVGIKFTRTGVLKVLPGVNVPISAVVNGRATSLLGAKARVYYATLPSGY